MDNLGITTWHQRKWRKKKRGTEWDFVHGRRVLCNWPNTNEKKNKKKKKEDEKKNELNNNIEVGRISVGSGEDDATKGFIDERINGECVVNVSVNDRNIDLIAEML